MKYEELLVRDAYEREYRWKCSECKSPLAKTGIRWGEWKNGSVCHAMFGTVYHKNLSKCCNAQVRVRV